VLTDLKNRGVADVCIAVCDGLKGLPDAINEGLLRIPSREAFSHSAQDTF
jgi:putative transposase